MTPLMFLLLLWAGVTTGSLQKRVTGSQDCDDNDRQYHVKLTATHSVDGVSTGISTICGGTLIGQRWILTAAHCWQEHDAALIELGMEGEWKHDAKLKLHPPPSKLNTFLANIRMGNKGKEVAIQSTFFYEEDERRHDIMLMKIPSSGHLSTISLPTQCPTGNPRPAPLQAGTVVQVAGYGAFEVTTGAAHTFDPSKWSSTLRCANMEVVDCGHINPVFGNLNRVFFCGRRDGVEITIGDSGGGVVYNDQSDPTHGKQIYGVMSGGGTFEGKVPAVFMDVCYYKEWIENTMNSNKE